MKLHLRQMIVAPEPSASPVAALYLALVAAAALAASLAVLFAGGRP